MNSPGRPYRRVRKLMLYSHDTYGLGHLRRNLRIAGHLLGAADGLRIVLVTGSPVAGYFPVPDGLTVVKLPSVRKVGAERYQPVDSGIGIGLIRRTRTAIMCDVVRRFRPDALLVDHSPAGMNGELLGVFDAIREHSPATRTVLGLRDILDEPAAVLRTWTEQGIYRILEQVYDQVVVYGSQDMFDVGAAYRLPGPVRSRLAYCGYLRPTPPVQPADPAAPASPYLLATAGGGGDGMAALTGAIEAAQELRMRAIVVTGPLIDGSDTDELEAAAARAGEVELVRFHPDLPAAMAAATALVTMGGYNSMCEAVAAGPPVIVVPRCQPRLEQTIRARLFADRGLVRVVEPGPELGRRIAGAVQASQLEKPKIYAENGGPAVRTAQSPLDFGGLDRLASALLAEPGQRDPALPQRLIPQPAVRHLADRRPA